MDFKVLDEIRNAATLEEAAELLGNEIGLEGPTPKEVTERALNEPLYARALVSSQNIPDLRDHLLAQPSSVKLSASKSSAPQMMKHAAGSLLKWGMEGLKPAKPWTIERRLEACNSCEYQVPAPDTLIYRGAKVVVGEDAKICVRCNCLTNTKAAISTEHCPEKSTANPELSRWGEPWIPKDQHPKGPW